MTEVERFVKIRVEIPDGKRGFEILDKKLPMDPEGYLKFALTI